MCALKGSGKRGKVSKDCCGGERAASPRNEEACWSIVVGEVGDVAIDTDLVRDRVMGDMMGVLYREGGETTAIPFGGELSG